MAGLFPNYILRETNNDGKMLSGGRIYFYESGTYTPKTVYSDYTLSMPLTNPVVLDASGSADIWLGDGAYRVLLTTSTGTQVRAPIDGITGTGGGAFGAGSNASVSVYKIYQDLRNDTNAPDVAYCCGATAIGDGGAGWFNKIITSEPDDNGICLVQGSTSYKRVYSGYISPEWYGVAYGVGVDQTYQINAAFAGSVRWNVPVRLTGSVYVSQNINIPPQASLYTMAGGYFVGPGPTAVQITFASGSHIDGDNSVVFGDNIQPIFNAGVCDAIRLSWIGGDDDYVVWAKLDVASTAPYQVLVDRTTTLDASNLSIASNYSLKFVAGCMVNFTGSTACNVDIVLDHDAPTQIMSFATTACVGTINLHNTKCYMEWFGGSYVNTGTSNAIPFRACIKAKQLDLLPGNLNYTVTSTDALSYSEFVTWNGNGSKLTLNQNVTVLGLYANDITIHGTGSVTHSSLVATKTSSIIQLLQGPTSLIDSNVTYVTWLVHAQSSQVSDLAKITGKITDTVIARSGTVEIVGELSMSGGSVTGEAVAPAFSVLDDSITKSSFTGVHVDVGGTFLYSDNADLVVDCIGCNCLAWSLGYAVHNGIATVNLSGCNDVGKNQTVASIDGIDQNPLIKIVPTLDASTVTASTTNWRGIGSVSSDGTWLILGADATLGTLYSANTIRYIGTNTTWSGGGVQVDQLMSTLYRYGGAITMDVQYPAGSAPDPNTRLVLWCGIPPFGSNPASGAAGYNYNNMPVTFGESTAVAMPAINGAVLRSRINVWGGQVDLKVKDTLGGAFPVGDIYGDTTQAIPSSTITQVVRMARIVIYNAGTGTLPTGTKIKIVVDPSIPSTEQYEKFWPATPYQLYKLSTFYGDVGGTYSVNAYTSLSDAPYSISTYQIDTPYSFRTCDANGLQTSLARVAEATETKAAMVLPVTVWADGTTLNGSYS